MNKVKISSLYDIFDDTIKASKVFLNIFINNEIAIDEEKIKLYYFFSLI